MKSNPIPGPPQRTPEWYALRHMILGASESAAMCGLSEWKMALDVYNDKVHPKEDSEPTEAMMVGTCLEPGIRELYSQMVGMEVRGNQPLFYHGDQKGIAYPLIASPDGIREDGRLVEVKWSMSPYVAQQLGDEGSDWVPTDWLFQGQQQMDVMGAETVDFAVLLFGKLKVYTVHRDDTIINAIHTAANDLRNRIAKKDPPPIDFTHGNALAAVKKQYPHVEEVRMSLEDEALVYAQRYVALSGQISGLQKEKDEAQAAILAAMGSCSHADVPGELYEFRRKEIPSKEISYVRKPYVLLTKAKVKG